MSAAADFTDDGGVLHFTGDLSLARLGKLPERLDGFSGEVRAVDLSRVDRVDTIGAWVVHRFARARGVPVEGLSGDARHLLDQVEIGRAHV